MDLLAKGIIVPTAGTHALPSEAAKHEQTVQMGICALPPEAGTGRHNSADSVMGTMRKPQCQRGAEAGLRSQALACYPCNAKKSW